MENINGIGETPTKIKKYTIVLKEIRCSGKTPEEIEKIFYKRYVLDYILSFKAYIVDEDGNYVGEYKNGRVIYMTQPSP